MYNVYIILVYIYIARRTFILTITRTIKVIDLIADTYNDDKNGLFSKVSRSLNVFIFSF